MNNEPNTQPDTQDQPNNQNQNPFQPTEQPSQQPAWQPAKQPESDPYNQPVAQPVEPAPGYPQPYAAEPVQNYNAAPVAPSDPNATPVGYAPVAPTPEPYVQSEAPKKKKKGLLIAGIVTAALLILLGGGSALAYTLWYQNPDKVVGDALVNAITAETVSGTGNIEIKNDDYTVKMELSGRTTTEATGLLDVKFDYTADDVSYVVNGEGIFGPEGDLFLKLDNPKELTDKLSEQSGGTVDYSTIFSGVIEKIDGNWVKISSKDLEAYSPDFKDTQKCIADYTTSLKNDKALQKTVSREIVNIYTANKFINVTENLGTKDINGASSLGYKLAFDAEKSKAFTGALADSQLGKKLKECDESFDFKAIAEDMSTEKDEVTKTELWVSTFAHEITEITVSGDDEAGTGFIKFQPVFNKNEAIAIPENTVTLEELSADIEQAYSEYYTQYYGQMGLDVTSSIDLSTES